MIAEPIALRLQQIRWEAQGVRSYELVSASGAALPAFTAGSHVELHLPDDRRRSYSLLNDPAETGRYVIAVALERDGRGGSAWMHRDAQVGQSLLVGPPRNDFPLVEEAPESIFIAGGIGITPVLSMLRRLESLRRPWQLHYAGRSPEQTAFVDTLRALDQGRGRLHCCFGSNGGARLNIAAVVAAAPPRAHLYCCGPARMLEDFESAGAARAAHTMHLERFAASRAAATSGAFEVILKRSAMRLLVPPGKTILDTLLDHAVDVPYACTAGVCGTCRTGVLAGLPDHRDDYLSADEQRANDCVMVCCSGSLTPELVLDL